MYSPRKRCACYTGAGMPIQETQAAWWTTAGLRIQWPKIDFLTLTPNRVSASNSAAPGGWGLLPWYLL